MHPKKVPAYRRVSGVFKLSKAQSHLDFVDVDVMGDVGLFVDPNAIRALPTTWGAECVSLLQSFFEAVLAAIRDGRDADVLKLLYGLHEPNETHLGLSSKRAKGRAVGRELAERLRDTIAESGAAISGLLVDLEDTALLVDGIGSDIVSDLVTNIIRGPLIHYTQEMAAVYGIPLTPGVDSGVQWGPGHQRWFTAPADLPVTRYGKLLLVPKVIVRRHIDYASADYLSLFILPHLRDIELDAKSSLVELLRDGSRRVTKKRLIEKYGNSKQTVRDITSSTPDLLAKYRTAKRTLVAPPMSQEDLADASGIAPPDWDALVDAVTSVPTGNAGATDYERAIENLVAALFSPDLSFPTRQVAIHDGRKRIDLTFANTAQSGFFRWLSLNYPSSHLMFECKNYSGDPANPELDQLAGRFSPNRGQVGFLVCRSFADKDLFTQRCRDTADDHRGYIIPLDDSDLRNLVAARRANDHTRIADLLKAKFDKLIL